jgi:FkbM family methyltransferase
VPEANLVFGYLAEDLIASRLLGAHARKGFYVDIGCHDPVQLSNTLLLYQAGWRGVNVDAQPRIVAEVARQRPGDRCVCALVGEPAQQRELVVFGDGALSTADPTLAAAWAEKSPVVARLPMETRSLSDILDEHGPIPTVDFLNVDVEGMELEVLSSLDFARYDVRLLAAEIHGLSLASPSSAPLVQFLDGRGFVLIAYNGLTAFFEQRTDGPRGIPGL